MQNESCPILDTEEIEKPTKEEVFQIIDRGKNGKVPGNDGISMEVIKYCGKMLKEKIHTLIAEIWTKERIPTVWETGIIIPIHKKTRQDGMQKLQWHYIIEKNL